ncbi:hypothetical protein DFO66_104252 [Brevibacterium sanguinis]|uniref:DUF4386 family protein n=2 Tax=Brevibacterium TaxID=1696 RepID=A0A366IJJ2_9MICO|nr:MULTISPECIES: hypothetical protein [Brevibacterium]RBP65666.1 hypothetical protein DFO66_104252 [Brevibacterium sanguinis]RBP72300.1 hypothetical protein DFO65_104258 [Brevibacterium celere]
MSTVPDANTTPGNDRRPAPVAPTDAVAGSRPRPPEFRPPRTWAWIGVAAGALGIATIQASLATSIDWANSAGDAEAILADAAGKQSAFIVFHVLSMLTFLALPVFGAGLKRRLDQQGPASGLHGQIALGGIILTAAALLLGSGLNTQFALGFSDTSMYVPESVAFYTDWVGTIPWLWVGTGLSAIAVAAASLRHGAVHKWIGVVSLVLGVLIVLTGVSPFQYLAGFIGPVWVLIASLGFALGDRR